MRGDSTLEHEAIHFDDHRPVGSGQIARTKVPGGRRGAAPRILVVYEIVLVAVTIFVLSAGPRDSGVKVTRQDFGEVWPLTISQGVLRCEFRGEITLQKDGTVYTLNRPPARSANSDITPLLGSRPDGRAKALDPLIERARQLCH